MRITPVIGVMLFVRRERLSSVTTIPSANTEDAKMRIIAALALSLLATGTTTAAETLTPDEVREKYPMAYMGPCVDHESKEFGTCHVFPIGDGQVYMVFVQDGKPVFMRITKPDGYETVWTAVKGVSL